MDNDKTELERKDPANQGQELPPHPITHNQAKAIYVGLTRDDHLGENANGPATAKRFNSGKPQLSFVLEFPNATAGVANVMEMGADKYGRDNWKLGGLSDESFMDSCLRHMTKFINGEEVDEESGHNHIDHAIVNLMMLRESIARQSSDQ